MFRHPSYTLYGGIGSQISRLFFCIGDLILSDCTPSNFMLNISIYPANQSKLLVHNIQLISNYLNFNPDISLLYVRRPRVPDIPFDQRLIYASFSSPSLLFSLFLSCSVEFNQQHPAIRLCGFFWAIAAHQFNFMMFFY